MNLDSPLEGVALKRFTTWGVGGPAQCLYLPSTKASLQSFLKSIPPSTPQHLLGLGSNVLIADEGLPGVTLILSRGLKALEWASADTLYVQAGISCAKLARFAASTWPAAAFWAGIPGTLGGALAMNAGAFGGETWPWVSEIEWMRPNGECFWLPADAFVVGYRSVQRPEPGYFVGARLKAPIGGTQEGLAIQALLKKRAETQPIGQRSCGSVFKNPPGGFAARYIEALDFKGHRIGGAMVSPRHANFIVNDAEATAQDCYELLTQVQAAVWQRFRVTLIPEVRILGRFHKDISHANSRTLLERRDVLPEQSRTALSE